MPLTSAASAHSPAHVHLGVIDAERLDLDDHFAALGQRLRNIGVDEAVQPAEPLEDDGTHGFAAGPFAHDRGAVGSWGASVVDT